MVVYEKIQTLYKRDPYNRYVIMPGKYSRDEFPNVTFWEVTEQLDGINVCVVYDGLRGEIGVTAKTDRAYLQGPLLQRVEELFTPDKFEQAFDMEKIRTVTLYGEGYGSKIKKGGKYRKNQDFILFDILIDEKVWLEGESVTDKAGRLGIERVPVLGIMPIWQITELIHTGPQSIIAKEPRVMEGVVCRSVPLMLDRFGKRIIFKLKVRDYEQLERLAELKKK